MPTTPPRRANPKDLQAKHPVDRRTHPIEGMGYRVLDPGWAKLYGQNLPWLEAKKLKNMIANRRISSTVMIEAEDVPVPEAFAEAAAKARRELLGAPDASSPPVTPAPLIETPPIKVIGGVGTAPVITSRPPASSLEMLQSNAMAAAGKAAADAQARSEAAQRRAEYRRQGEQARKELEELSKKADELGGGDDVGEAEIADFLDGTGMPTDAEIAKAKAAANAPK